MNQRQPLRSTSIRLSHQQSEKWGRAAKNSGYQNTSEFVRSVVDGLIEHGVTHKDSYDELIRQFHSSLTELSRIGNNLNQIAKHANSTVFIQSDIDRVLTNIDERSDKLIDALKLIQKAQFRKLGGRRKGQTDDRQNGCSKG